MQEGLGTRDGDWLKKNKKKDRDPRAARRDKETERCGGSKGRVPMEKKRITAEIEDVDVNNVRRNAKTTR